MFFYNPNIAPVEEYEHRRDEQLRLCSEWQIPARVFDYQPECFSAATKGLEGEPEGGARCRACFELRLDVVAALAKKEGFDYFATTLTVSPHKHAQVINRVGETLAEKYGIAWLPSDFKKKNGYLRSLQLSAEYGLYRQNYRGCLFSKGN